MSEPDNDYANMIANAMGETMNALIPIGSLIVWPGKKDPDTALWLPCDGRTVPKDKYPDLFKFLTDAALINDTGGTAFTLPEIKMDAPILLRGAVMLIRAR